MRVRVFIACSLDGYVAGPEDDLSWLPPQDPAEDHGYGVFMAETDAVLVGRRTYDVAAGFDTWPFPHVPVFVATTRPIERNTQAVRPISGTPAELLSAVRAEVGGAIYLDGAQLIRAFLDARLIDELTITVVPTILGAGVPLFAGATGPVPLELVEAKHYSNGLVQLRYLPDRARLGDERLAPGCKNA